MRYWKVWVLALGGITVSAARGDIREVSDWKMIRQQARDAARDGQFTQAQLILHSGLERLGNAPSEGSVVLWNELGTVEQSLFRLDQAESAFRRALALEADLKRPGEIESAIALNNLGTVAGQRSSPAEAEHLLREAWLVLERAGQVNGETAALVTGNLALTMQQLGRLPEAAEFYSKAAPAVRHWYGEESIEFARLEANRSLFAYQCGDYLASLEAGREAVAIENRLPFVTASDRARTLNNLGLTLTRLGRQDEAEAALREAILRERAPGPDGRHQLLETLNNLAALEEQAGKLDQARQYEAEALQLSADGVPVSDFTMAAIWNNLGRIAQSSHDYKGAAKLYARARAQWEKHGQANSPQYAATLSNIAGLEAAQQHHKKAEALFRNALTINEARLGPEHPAVAADLVNLAGQLFYEKHPDAALECYERARQIQETRLGVDNVEVARTIRNEAVIFRATGRLTQASDRYAAAIGKLERWSGKSTPVMAVWLHEYAETLRREQQFGAAEAAETRAVGIEVRSALAADRNAARPATDTSAHAGKT